jgi:two-component system, OmpR family, sensor histidine kinase QseC
MKRRSLLGHLLAWALGALGVVWVGFIVVGLRTGMHEADELTDGHLASTASLLLSESRNEFIGTRDAAPPAPELKSHDYQQSMSVMVWDGKGQLLSHTGLAEPPPFDTHEGFATLQLGTPAQAWRTFARWDSPAHGRRLMVALSIEERDDLAWDIAAQVAEPGLWMLPVIALVLGLAIRRGLRPLSRLSSEVEALNIQAGTPLQADQRHEEFKAVVESINALIERYQAALARERQLAGELAHELRTPLASIALHAQSLKGELTASERERATSRVASDSLRAGEVLQHLLTLARTSHAELAEAAAPFDVVPLASRVLADHAQAALDGRHELVLSGSPACRIDGHELLFELALRNLVENALGHAPPDSVVEVAIDAEARWLQVTNAQRSNDAAEPSQAAGLARLGLGLGHRVVDKVAALHGARFAEVSGQPGTRSYRISFPPAQE